MHKELEKKFFAKKKIKSKIPTYFLISILKSKNFDTFYISILYERPTVFKNI